MSRPLGPGVLVALVLAAGCSKAAAPAGPAIQVQGGPLATAETGTRATFQVRLATAPTAPVDLDVRSEDPTEGLLLAPGAVTPAALVALRFTPADWSAAQVVTVVGVDDAVRDGDVSYLVRLSVSGSADAGYAAAADATVTVVNHDDDVPAVLVSRTQLRTDEGGGSDAFEVVLSTQPMGTVSVAVVSGAPGEGKLRGGTDPLTAAASIRLVFTPSSWDIPQQVTVIGQPDHVVDGDQTYAVTVGPATGDSGYAALPAQQVTVVNADADAPGVLISGAPVTVAEWSTVSFGVRLATIPSAPVTVPVVSGDPARALLGGPANPVYVPSIALTFDATTWDVPQQVVVQGQGDYTVSGPHQLAITVGPPSGDPGYAALPAAVVNATVTDTDVPGLTWFIDDGRYYLLIGEAGATSTFHVALQAGPTADVTVPVVSSDPAEALLSIGGAPPSPSLTLTFTPTNWSTAQAVTVSSVNDSILEAGPPHPFNVAVGPTSSASPSYDGVAGFTLPGVNYDDDVGANQGTAVAPIDVTGQLPYPGQVGTGSSFYRVTGFTDGGWVGVRGNVEPLRVTAWSDEVVPVVLCRGTTLYYDQPACAVRKPPSGTVVLEVSGALTARGDAFTVFANPFVFSTDTPLAIPDFSTAGAVSTITLSGFGGAGGDVAVLLDVVHPAVNELAVMVTLPGGGQMYGITSTPGGGADFDSTVLAPSGETYISAGTAPFAGVYHPPFNLPSGGDGTWTLTVRDQVLGNTGTLVRWGIAVR